MSFAAQILRPRVLLVLAFALLWCANLDHRVLQHPDEGRYAEIAREMAASGDWVTPRLNGLKYFEKPPLQYWLTASLFRGFGVDEWTARLVPVLSGIAGVLAVAWAGARIGGPPLGWMAGVLLAGTLWHVALAQIVSLDSLLSALLAVGFAGFVIAQQQGPERTRTRGMLIAWLAVALATLTKGLVALVIPAGAITLYCLVQRDATLLRRLRPGVGLIALLLIVTPWFVAVSVANAEFAQFFFVQEHLQRYLTTEHRRVGSWWYFVPLLLVGGMPSLPAIAAGWRHLRQARVAPGTFTWHRFALCWGAFVFVFFSVSGSKLPSYILPMFPPLALLAAWCFLQLPARRLAATAWWLGIPAAVLAFASIAAYRPLVMRFAPADQPIGALLDFAPYVRSAFAVAAVAGIVAWAFLRRGDEGRFAGAAALSLGTLIAVQAVVAGTDTFRATRSSYDMLRAGQRLLAAPDRLDAPNLPFFQVHMYDQTAPFYLRRTTTLVGFRDELSLGSDAEPAKVVASVSAWRPVWRELPQGFALIEPESYDALAREGLPMRLLARDTRRVLVSRR